MPSTDIDEYAPTNSVPAPSDYLLIVGNSFAHKAVPETAELIRAALPDQRIKVLGIKLSGLPARHSYDSGALDFPVVSDLYANSRAVIFPSHYEGFGFPLLHALGSRRPVFVRDLPVYEEIKGRVACPQNIYVFDSGDELVRALTANNFKWDPARRDVGDVGWDRSARELERILSKSLASATAEKIDARLAQLELIAGAFNGSQTRVRQLEDQIKGFERSTSWRLTAPLRKLKLWLS